MPSSCFIDVSSAEYQHCSFLLCPRSHHGRKLCYCKAIRGIRSTLLLSMTIETGCSRTEKILLVGDEAGGDPKTESHTYARRFDSCQRVRGKTALQDLVPGPLPRGR